MSKLNIIFLLAALVFMYFSCQKAYEPGAMDNNDSIPVINGYMDNDSGPYQVTLQWASKFNSDDLHPISGAKVSIIENGDRIEYLEESSKGTYRSQKEQLVGQVGNTYFLRIELPDGYVYESRPTKMRDIPKIDSLYSRIGTFDRVEKNSYGEIYVRTEKGLNVYYDASDLAADSRYYRVSANVLYQSYYIRNPDSPFPIYVYCWHSGGFVNLGCIKQGVFDGHDYQIREKELGFLAYNPVFNFQSDTSSVLYPSGWIITFRVHSIAPEIFSFYDMMNEQLSAEDRIFDPLPSQILSNFKCVNDSTRTVLGIFEVAAKKTWYKAFYWSRGSEKFYDIDLDSYSGPQYGRGCQDTLPPSFWIHSFQFYDD